jgi:hypothetical protein
LVQIIIDMQVVDAEVVDAERTPNGGVVYVLRTKYGIVRRQIGEVLR